MNPSTCWRCCAAVVLLGLTVGREAASQDLLGQFEGKVTEFTLDNGLHFLVIERHEAPVVSFYTYADVGSVDEVKGITGLAHMFEHMAFKGTSRIGSKDIEAERAAMRKEDEAYAALRREQHRGERADTARLASLAAAFDEAKKAAQAFVEPEFEQAIERNGGTGLNASTWTDRTDYYYSLPSNKVELWFSLESERFLDPMLREFYVERDVVAEERRMRIESNPMGRLMEEFFTTAFKAHPYGEPGIGHMSDIQSYTREEGYAFFKKYYGASNLTIAVAGDVAPDQVRRLAQTYFGRLASGEKPDPVETVEPLQIAERRIVIEEQSQPLVLMGWHKGNVNHPDDPVFDVLADILSNGRTSRLYRQLVEGEKLALAAQALNSFPGMNKYPNLFLAFGVTNQGKTPEELEAAIHRIVDDIRENGVTAEELQRAKTRARADLIRQLQSNEGLAIQLTYNEVVTGDWRNLFRRLEQIEATTSEDVQRVVRETFTKQNRTVAMIRTAGAGAPTAAATTGAGTGGGR